MILKCVGAAAFLFFLAVPAQAQMVKAQDPQSLVRAMEAAGHSATLGTDKTGDPMISSSIGGTKFQVYFYNCTQNKNCATVQFATGYTLKSDIALTRINEWNSRQRFGRAFLDGEGDPILQMDLDLDDGGVSQALFVDNLQFWSAVVTGFQKHIGWQQ